MSGKPVTFTTGAKPVTAVASAGVPVISIPSGGLPMTLVDSGGQPIVIISGDVPPSEIATITILSVGAQGSNGDVAVSYNIDMDDATVKGVIFPAASANPTAAQMDGGGAYISQGTVGLTTTGSPINLDITGTFNGSVKLALLPTGGGDSHVVVSEAFTLDTTAPVLTSATGAQTGTTTASWGVTSDSAGGTIYAGVRPTASSALTAAQLIAGSGGAGVAWNTDTTPTADSANGGSFTGLTASTAYRVDIVHVDAFGNVSTVATSAEFTTASAAAFTLIGEAVDSAGFSTQRNASFSATAGDTVVICLTWISTNNVNSVVVDPGGGNETTATVRSNATSSAPRVAMYDVVWPATGSLNIRCNMSASVNVMGYVVLSAGSKTHQNSILATQASTNPQFVSGSLNTTAGHSAIMHAHNAAGNLAATLTSGVDTPVGTGGRMLLTSNYYAHTATKDSVAGGTPEAFRMDWSSTGSATSAVIGIYA
jgi:hypothetical protein